MHIGNRPCLTMTLLCLGLAPFVPAAAQQAAAPAAAPAAAAVDRAQLENYIRVMTVEVERAEARAEATKAQLLSLDDDIESRVNRMVSLLSSVRDSAEGSSVRMRKAKEDALAGLKATAVYYAQQRDFRKKAMANPASSIDDETLAKNVAALNARIEKRVEQSLDITASLVRQEDGRIERHQNWDTDYASETREQRKVDHDVSTSAKIKAEMAQTLRASIEKLSNDVKASEAEAATTKDPERQAQLGEDIKVLRQTIEARQGQLDELLTGSPTATSPVSSKGAFEMDKMLDEMTQDLRTDFVKFKTLVGELDTARARVKPLKDRLAKATAMLKAAE